MALTRRKHPTDFTFTGKRVDASDALPNPVRYTDPTGHRVYGDEDWQNTVTVKPIAGSGETGSGNGKRGGTTNCTSSYLWYWLLRLWSAFARESDELRSNAEFVEKDACQRRGNMQSFVVRYENTRTAHERKSHLEGIGSAEIQRGTPFSGLACNGFCNRNGRQVVRVKEIFS